jgi:hypothetical protein
VDGPTDRSAPPSAEAARAAADSSPSPPPAEPRQRWRLTYARDAIAAELLGRATQDAWTDALVASGLPVAGLEAGGARPRIAFGAPLQAGASGEAELADVWLLERLPLWRVRQGLAPRLPDGHRWVGAEDVWLGAPALAGRVAAADWRVEVAGAERHDAREALVSAMAWIRAAPELPRVRLKGSVEKRYDLRPLLEAVSLDDPPVGDAAAATTLRIRTRFHPELGAGRPEEVVAELGERAGVALEVLRLVRERLVLAEIAPADASRGPGQPARSARCGPVLRRPVQPPRR